MTIKEWLRRAARASRGLFREKEGAADEDIDEAEDTINGTDSKPSGHSGSGREADGDFVEGQDDES